MQYDSVNSKINYLGIKKIIVSIILGLLTSFALFAQPQLITPGANYDPYPVRFTDEEQRIITIELTEAVTVASGTTGWTFSVGGSGVAAVGPIVSGNTINFQLASPISYDQRLNVRVSYNGTGNIVGVNSGLQLGVISNYQAINNFKFDCSSGLTGVQSIGTVSLVACAPTKVKYSVRYEVNRRTRNSIYFSRLQARVYYQDPLNYTYDHILMSEIGLTGSGSFYAETEEFTYQVQDVCFFSPYAYPAFLNANSYPAFSCYNSAARQNYFIPSYQLDNQFSGDLVVYPEIDNPRNLYCVGEDVPGHVFEDNTAFNCRFEVEPERPNIAERVVQFIYGTNLNGGQRIPNVFIDVEGTMVQITDGSGNPISFPTPSGFYEGPVFHYDQLPLPGDDGTSYPSHQAYPIYHAGDFSDVAGMRFEVTMRMWGPCNPYNIFDISNRIEQHSYIELIEAPPAPIAGSPTYCFGSVTPALTASGTTGILKWYSNPELTTQVGLGNSYTHGHTEPGTYRYYVNETLGNGCPGPATEVILTINPIPNKPTISRNNPDFCYDGVSSITLTANPHSPPAVTSYQWYSGNTPVGSGTSTLTLTTPAQSGTYRVKSFGIANTYCESPLSDPVTIVIGQPVTATITTSSGTICSNSTFSINATTSGPVTSRSWSSTGNGSFSAINANNTVYTPGSGDIGNTITITFTANTNLPCGPDNDQITLTVVAAPSVNAGSDAAICQSDTYTVSDATASNYNTISWTRVTGTGTLANANTLTPTYTPGPADAGQTITLRLTATGNSPCGNVSDDKRIFIDRTPVATANLSQEICGTASAVATLQGNTGGNDLANGATGIWSFPSIWKEDFNDLADGTTSDGGATSWSRTRSYSVSGWYSAVRDQRFETTGTLTTWTSGIIDISSYPSAGVSIDFSSMSPSGFETSDYIRVRLIIDGTLGPVVWSCAGAVDGSTSNASKAFRTRTATASGIIGSTLRIQIQAYTNVTNEFYYFDNITVTSGNTPVIANPASPTSTVTNLPSGPTTFTWTVSSAHGGCAPATANHTITRWDPPTTANAGDDDEVCADVSTYTLAANTPIIGTGEWSTTGGATITNRFLPNTTVSNLDLGNNEFTWTITNGNCTPSTDVVNIFRNRPVVPGSISADQNICEGETPVALNGTNASGGDGTTYSYSWQYSEDSSGGPWTTIPSTNSTGYSFTAPLTTTTWFRRLVSSGDTSCTTQQNVPSTNVVQIFVEPELLPGEISGNQSICLGDQPTGFTSVSPASGGSSPSYQWYHKFNAGAWEPISGETNLTYTAPNSLNVGTHYYYRQAISSTGYCDPVISNEIHILVNPDKAKEIHSITGLANRCENQTIDLTYAAVADAIEYVWDFSWIPGEVDATTATPSISINLSTYTFASPYQDITVSAAGINGCNTNPDHSTGDYPWSAPHSIRVYRNPDAEAGADSSVCDNLSIGLSATPSVGTGTWSDTGSGPGTVSFSNANLATATATATLYGTYILQWTENNGGCTDVDNVTVTFYEQPTVTAPDDLNLCDTLTTTLTATGHTYQTGSTPSPTFLWEYVSGPDNSPSFGSATASTTTVTVDYYGTYRFRITETNGTCSHFDYVDVVFSENPVNASAGDTVSVDCDQLSTNLNGTAHSYLGGSNVNAGTRTWSYVSGPDNTPVFSNTGDPHTQVSVDSYGNYVFRWTETNGACQVYDDVTVKFFEDPDGIVGSGPYEAGCGLKNIDISVTAHTYSGPAATHPESTRGWSRRSGPDQSPVFSHPNDPSTNVAVDNYGTYVFRWTETNGTCSKYTDVTVTFYEDPSGASAGNDIMALCNSKSVNLAGIAHEYEASPSTHTGSSRGWIYISGPDNNPSFTSPTSPTSEVTVDYYGIYEFEWFEINGNCERRDTVVVRFSEDPVDASAGNDIIADCDTLVATLAGTAHTYDNLPNTHPGSTRTWTRVSGPDVNPVFTDATDPNTDVEVDYYGTYVFRWTEVNGNCTRTDDVTVTFREKPVNASAGLPVYGSCGSLEATLAGTAHVYEGSPNDHTGSTRTWSYVSGPDDTPVFDNSSNPTTDVTVDRYGVYEFRWTETNGNCTVSSVTTVTFYEAPAVTVAPVADLCRDSSLAVIPITGSFSGGASSATWSIVTGDGTIQNAEVTGNIVTAEYVPVYSDITAGSVTLRLTTDDPEGPCNPVHANLTINIDEAVYVVIDQAPLLIIAEGTSAVITATISGARGTVTTGTWTEQGALTGGDFDPGITSNNITFTPTPAQEAAGSVVLRLTSANPGTTCSPAFAEITILIGANPVADAGPDIETCEPADSLLHLSGYAKASANDANWSVLPGGFGTIISQTKTWSSPQSTPHDENDSLLVEAVYRLHPSDYGTPNTGSSFGFRLRTDDPDGAGPVSDDYDDMTYTVHWSPKTPPVGGGGRTVTCVNSMGNYYAVPLNTGNTYAWEIEVLTGNGVPGTDYLVAQGGTGYNYIVIHWYNEGTYNLKVTETTYLTDGTPCVGETVIQPIGVYSQPLVTAGRDTTLCIGGSAGLSSSVTGGSGSYLYEWSPSIGLSAFNIPNPVVTGTYLGDVVYTVKFTDLISGCQSSTATVTITTVPLPDIFTLSGNAFYCYGSAEGATLTLSGSETNVLYQLMNGATAVGTPRSGTGDTLQWKNNFDGSYFVEAVRNATPACERTMAGIVNITANPEIVMTVNQIVNTNCYGSDEGRISISVTGGTAPYTYLWSGPASFSSTNEDISSLYAGDYFVEVTDSRGCKFMSSAITVSQPDELVIASVNEIQAVTCYGGSDGSAEVTMEPGTGTPPYTYQWFYNAALSSPVVPEAVSSVLSGVPAGTYYVLVMDNNLCTVTGSVTISQPDQITGSVQLVTPVSCNGESDAVIQVTASGGSGSFEFDLNGEGTWANTDGLFSGLGRGSYTLRVRDANATVCVVNLPDVAITEPAVLTISASVTSNYNGAQISCTSADDGIITVSGSGGTAPYVFNIDGGDFAAGTTFVGLSAGSHTVGIRDARGCTDYTDINISSPDPVTGTASAVSDFNGYNVRCNGGADGVIEVIASGGTGTLRYSRDGTAFQLSNTFTGLTVGLYDITVRDANMCTFLIEDVEVTEPDELTASASVTTDFHGFGVSCFGAADGVVTASATGGAGTYLYRWYYNAALTLAVPGGNADVLSSLPTGTYYVRVTDANGCTASAEVTVTGPPELVITRSADVTLACNGDANGTGSFSVTGGTGVYTIVADVNGTGAVTVPGPSGLTFTGASGGVVSITVTDENDCSKTSSITINEPLPITASAEVTSNYNGSQLSCYGASDGRITVTAMGGTGVLSYVLTSDPSNVTGAESGVFTGLTAGVYNFIVSDVNGCEVPVGPVTITPPPQLEIVVNVISDFNGRDISCYGASDGRAEAVVTGGTGSYTYTWYRDPGLSNPLGQLTPVASNLIAGDYYVRARDINGCTIDGSVTLSQPRALAASVSDQENVDCFSAATGSVTVEANDTTGTAPYYYSIDGGSTWKDDGFFGNLTAMPYTVLVRDANDCVITVPFTITQPSQLVATVTALTHVSCNGGSNGSVTITPSAGSGTAPYRFSLNGEPAVASGVFSGLTAGSYVVTVIDDNDCSIDIPVMISEPPVLELNPTADVTLDCYGDRTGTGTFYAVGGTPNYSFAYDPADNTAGATFAAPGYNTQTIYNAGAGSVTVTVTDSKGCTATATISFTQPDSLTAGSITGDQVLCYGEDPGIISEADAPTGGPAPFDYRFQWQQSNSPTGIFINIPNATGPDYDPNPVNGATTTLYYRRMLTSGSCPPVYSNTVEVLVYPRPIARLRGGGSICPGDTAYLFVEMLAGMGPFTVDINGLTGPLTGYNSGDTIRVMPSATTTYSLLSVTDANMCTSSGPPNISGNATVTVYDLPQITSFTPSPAVCEFEYTTFSATATPAAVIYQWYVIDSTGVRALSDDNTYYGTNMPNLFIFNTTRWMNGNIYYVTASGCGAEDVSAQGVLTVNAAPEITLHPSDTVICLGQSAVMQADATAVQGLEWTWFVNRGSGLEIVHDEAPFSGSTTNTLTITSPPHTVSPWTFRAMARGVCGVPVYTHFASMRVINPPYFISQPASDAICENGSTYFRADARDFNTVNWQVNNGSGWMNLADDINHIGSTSQQLNVLNAPIALDGYRYRLALVSICDTVYSDPVTLTVHPNPVVDFSAIDPLAACGGVPLVIEGNPTGGSGIWSQHRWTGDVGPLNNYFIESPVFNVSITGNYNLTYRVTDSHGCYAEDNLTVIVDSPSALFSQNVDFGCTPLPVTFSKDMSEVAKWWWDFGDGSPLDSINAMPEHIFENSNTGSIEYFRVTLKVQSPGGCFAEYSSMITVYPEINASITPDKDIVCSGNSITFVADQGAKTYYWDFGDGAAGNGQSTMSHRYVNTDTVPVVYTVRLTTTSFYDCVDVAVYDITVMPVPGPQFSADPVMQVYDAAGNDVRFENTSAPGQWNWLWRFGDNTTSTERDPVHTYTDLGTYPVTLVAYNAVCRDSITREIRVVPPQPVAMFEDIPSGCAPWYIKPVNISENIDIPGTKFYWSFGDGSTSTAREPDYTYFTAGDYTVELYIEGPGGTSSYSQRVSAYPSPKAYFEITPERVYVNDERVRCFNLSQGAEWYIWDFGDGDTSKLKEPYHRYMTEGVYDITLWAHSSNGCTDKYILSPAVTVEPVGELRFASVFTPNKTGPVERTDLPTGGVEIDQFFYPSIRERVLEYKLQIFNRWGVLIFESHDINVPWNGYYNNELCPQGVYVWYVEGKYLDGKPFRQAGDVTLLH